MNAVELVRVRIVVRVGPGVDPDCQDAHPEAEADQGGQVSERGIPEPPQEAPGQTRTHLEETFF